MSEQSLCNINIFSVKNSTASLHLRTLESTSALYICRSHFRQWNHYQKAQKCRKYGIKQTAKKDIFWASLVAQWLRICLPTQGAQVQALVWEDPTCHGATKPVRHNYWACVLEPTSHNYWAHVLQLLKPVRLQPVLHNKRSHHNKKPAHHNEEQPPLATTRESPCAATKTQCSQNK